MLETSGIYGGRFSGAGFKGCCMVLIDPNKADVVREEVERKYLTDDWKFSQAAAEGGEKTILDCLVDDIDTAGLVDTYVVISNHTFAHHFEKWAAEKPQNIVVVDDRTNSNDTRLGAVCDVQFAIEKLGLDDNVLVIASDNVLDFALANFLDYARKKELPASCAALNWRKSLPCPGAIGAAHLSMITYGRMQNGWREQSKARNTVRMPLVVLLFGSRHCEINRRK